MAAVHPGRFTAAPGEDFVVFHIGMRFNKLWKVHRWLPVFTTMPRLLAALAKHPDKGLLGFRTVLDGKGVTVIQYWASMEQLMRFARGADDPHLAAWRRFNRRVGATGDVGIWHEAFPVTAGNEHVIYVNMPAFGLAKATTHRRVGRYDYPQPQPTTPTEDLGA